MAARSEDAAGDGRDIMGAIVRAPDSVFVHWDLSGPAGAGAVREPGRDVRWHLCIRDITAGASRRVPVAAAAGDCYVTVSPGHVYVFEMAAGAGSGARTICRTDAVHVPPDKPTTGGEAARSEAPPLPAGRAAVPGLRFETTPLNVGSSPGVPPAEEQQAR